MHVEVYNQRSCVHFSPAGLLQQHVAALFSQYSLGLSPQPLFLCTAIPLTLAAPQARLAELELPQLAAGIAAAAAAVRRKSAPQSQRGISTKRSRAEALPQRQSARTRGQAPDPSMAGGIDYEARDGRVVLAAFVPERYGNAGHVIDPSNPAMSAAAVVRPPPGPLPFTSSNGDESTDAAFLKQLQTYTAAGSDSTAAAAEEGSGGGSRGGVLGADGLMKLQLRAVDVAKLTPQGISCLAFHPSSSKPLIAASDKSGKVRANKRG